MTRLRNLGWTVLLVAALSGPALGQNIQNFRPAPGTWNGITVEGGRTAEHLQFVPSLMLSYGKDPLVERTANGDVARRLVQHLSTLNVIGTFGIMDRFEIGLDVPVHYASLNQDTGFDGGAAMGDLRLLPKVRLFGLDKRSPNVGLALVAPVNLPTGNADRFVGDDQVTIDPKLVFELDMQSFRVLLNGGVRIRPNRTAPERIELGSEVTYGAAVGVHLGSEDFELIGEVFGAAPLEDIQGAELAPLEGLLGLRLHTAPGAVFTLGAGTGIIASYGDPTARVFFGFAWNRHERDSDGDGILDEDDQCPHQPEDKDGFQDADGCPDPDNDGDGILDVNDACPDEPEDFDGFEDADGCPDPDNDGDGILDIHDKCPLQPEDIDGFQDEDGCPDPDNDGDGIPDIHDKCPNDPEDKDGFQDADGCPDPDNDRDGIPDVEDDCPNEPETINGFQDEDGCPDEGKSSVELRSDRIVILEKVFFEYDSDVIKDISFSVLNQVGAVMRANPQITKVLVEGHTDSKGSGSYNQALSERRAAAVKRYLVDRGTAASRLESKAFGESQPIDTNENRAGRARNRRVEFKIVDQRPDNRPGAIVP